MAEQKKKRNKKTEQKKNGTEKMEQRAVSRAEQHLCQRVDY